MNFDIEKVPCQEYYDNIPSYEQRVACVKNLYRILGFDMEDDIKLASACEPPSELVIATAGGGKTTWAQIKAIQQKIYRPARSGKGKIQGTSILCLVYNRHNVDDLKHKHSQMVRKINAAVSGLNLSETLYTCTLHSFCDAWRKEYTYKLNMVNYHILEASASQMMMATAESATMQGLGKGVQESKASDLCSLYTYMKESLLEPDQLAGNPKLLDVEYPLDVVKAIFRTYDNSKRVQRRYDFCDMLIKFYKLISEDKDVLERIQASFEYVIADEVQDFTPIMWNILKVLLSNGTPFVAIGDDDQNIYTFRGANIKDLFNFKENFKDAHIYSVGTNRRCPQNVLDLAVKAVSKNDYRFVKDIKGCKPDGEIELVPYKSLQGEIGNMINYLKTLDPRESCTICYRNNYISYAVSWELMLNDIDFHINSGFSAFQYELFGHLIDIYNILESPYEPELAINLYKVLPVKRKQVYDVFGFNPSTHSFSNLSHTKHFAEYDYGNLRGISGFSEIMDLLTKLSKNFQTLSVGAIFTQVMPLLKKYYWDYKIRQNPTGVDAYMEARISDFFKTTMKYTEFYKEISKKQNTITVNNDSHIGLALSTMHSLKGLEYNHVIIMDMDDGVFPNFDSIDASAYDDETKKQLKEAEVRLWYVALTRSKNTLRIYYSEKVPSIFVRDILAEEPKQSLEASNIFSDYLDFPDEQESTHINLNVTKLEAIPEEVVVAPEEEAEQEGTLEESEMSNVTFVKQSYLDSVFNRIKKG